MTAEVEGCLKLQLGFLPIDTYRPRDLGIHGIPGPTTYVFTGGLRAKNSRDYLSLVHAIN